MSALLDSIEFRVLCEHPLLTGAKAATLAPRIPRARGGQTSWWHSGLAAARREGPDATVDVINHDHVYPAACRSCAGQFTACRSRADQLTILCT
jgi:hypothetical protein